MEFDGTVWNVALVGALWRWRKAGKVNLAYALVLVGNRQLSHYLPVSI